MYSKALRFNSGVLLKWNKSGWLLITIFKENTIRSECFQVIDRKAIFIYYSIIGTSDCYRYD